LTLFDPDRGADAGAGSTRTTAATAPPSTRATPEATRTRLRLVVSYDGTGFRGFAAQPGQRTVGGALADAVARTAGHPVELVCAGRTDAGVHAEGQVVHIDVDPGVDPARLLRSVNAQLGPQVVVRAAAPAPPGFDARHSARARTYRYLLFESATPDPLLARVAWHVPGPLDVRAMVAAADVFVGEHDFRAFCRRVPGSEPGSPIVRRVIDTRVCEVPFGDQPGRHGGGDSGGRLLRFEVTANAFCHQMVRSMVGVLAEVGRGRRRVADVVWLLGAADRSRVGGVLAPPHGLCLVRVAYDDA